MARYIAFLRAINVGGRTVKMGRLRAHFEEMGFDRVETFIASGNVVFESPSRSARQLERTIEGALEKALGYPVATFVRSTKELGEVAARTPFSGMHEGDDSVLYITFLRNEPDAAAKKRLLAHESAIDMFAVHGREVYWRCRKTIGTSEFSGAKLEKALGQPATIRNATTVRKMAARWG